MTDGSMFKAAVVGTSVLFIGYVAWGYAVYVHAVTGVTSTLFLFLPGVAGFIATWIAPRHRAAPGVLLAIPAACFAAALHLWLQSAGVDVGYFAGTRGAFRVAMTTMLAAGMFAAIGGYLAAIARQGRPAGGAVTEQRRDR
jgi:hypothetical protein